MNSATPPSSPASPEVDLREKEARDEGSTVGSSRVVAEAKKVVPSWVSVAKDKRSLRKYDVERVPLHMFSWEGLSVITSAVGFPVKLHPETLACSNFEVAKVFVNVDVSKPLPREISFSKNGKEFAVDFHFPWLPTRCKLCKKWGHSDKVCALKGKDKVQEPPPVVPEEGKKSLETVLNKNVDMEDVTVGNLEINIAEGEGEPEANASENGEPEVNNGEQGDQGESNKWLLVSPSKAGRSPVFLSLKNQAADFQISGSKFSVLSNEDEEEGEIKGDGTQTPTVEESRCSDHMRCKIQLFQPKEKIQRPFKYVNAIERLPNFLPMIQAYWDSTEKIFHSTSAMYRFSKKLKNLKPLIRDLGREKLGNLSKRSEEAHVILCEK
ncbi:unnamed protein product, partial [Brassica oleracea var. botrytis]